MNERYVAHLELSSTDTDVSPRSYVLGSRVLLRAAPKILLLPGLLLGIVMFLVLLEPTQAQAARCSFPTEFYRPSLGVCETKAGNPLYRARSVGKTSSNKVKSTRVLDRAQSRPSVLTSVGQTPVAERDVAGTTIVNTKALPITQPAPLNDDAVAEFEARWWPIREVEQRELRGVQSREGQSPAKAVQ